MIKDSYAFVKGLFSCFNMNIEKAMENRIDYCFHTNFFENPSKYLSQDYLEHHLSTTMKQSLELSTIVINKDPSIKKGLILEKKYLALGRKKSNNVFFRMYDKAEEVISQGYKGFFFDIWLNAGLISYYDKWCYEYAYHAKNINLINKARLLFYMKYGTNPFTQHEFAQALNDPKTTYSRFEYLANEYTPKLTPVMNVEYETRRKFYAPSDNFINTMLHPAENTIQDRAFFNETPQLTRLFSVLDNRGIFTEYLTRVTASFRRDNRPLKLQKAAENFETKTSVVFAGMYNIEVAVDFAPHETPLSNIHEITYDTKDEHEEANRPVDNSEYEPFWLKLRATKTSNHDTSITLVREYSKNIDQVAVAKKMIIAAQTNAAYAMAMKGQAQGMSKEQQVEELKQTSLIEDISNTIDYITSLNDNDMHRLFSLYDIGKVIKLGRVRNKIGTNKDESARTEDEPAGATDTPMGDHDDTATAPMHDHNDQHSQTQKENKTP